MCDGYECTEGFPLFVDLASVRDSRYVDGSGRVVNDINYPVVANANPPFVVAALQFFAARRPRSRRQMFETGKNVGNHLLWQAVQFFLRACGQRYAIATQRESLPLLTSPAF